jgi:uncharacterized protein (DUF302 family)
MTSRACLCYLFAMVLAGCGQSEPPSNERLAAVDALYQRVVTNIQNAPTLEVLLDIDHSRLGAAEGSFMPPARVLLFSDPSLEAALLAENPLFGVELPFRVLAHESTSDGRARLIFNRYDYVASRYGLPSDGSLRARYTAAHERAIDGVPEEQLAEFALNDMQPDGIVTFTSPFDFSETVRRVEAAIAAQDDTVTFGRLDLTARALEHDVALRPMTLILFGGPDPGAKAMADAPTLGLDGFCQKFLVWTDEQGVTHLSFNDLLALAERQDVKKALALRVVTRRLDTVFRQALELSEE